MAPGDIQTSTTSVVRPMGTETTWRDTIGGRLLRWSIRRMDYSVKPGFYRVGSSNADSPVLVTANYKLAVDLVRSHLTGLNVWLLVLDTKGVHVPAGGGTFGTEELVRRIASVNLADVVKHRNVIVPQLGATGVAAHEVKRATGFSVRYGPVRASDIPAYLAAGMRATPAIRRVRFGWKYRLVLAPVELVGALKPLAPVVAALLVLTLVRNHRLTGHFGVDVAPFIPAV